jgi:predicted transcriptional regulator
MNEFLVSNSAEIIVVRRELNVSEEHVAPICMVENKAIQKYQEKQATSRRWRLYCDM